MKLHVFGPFPAVEKGIVKPRVAATDEDRLSNDETLRNIADGVDQLREFLNRTEENVSPERYVFWLTLEYRTQRSYISETQTWSSLRASTTLCESPRCWKRMRPSSFQSWEYTSFRGMERHEGRRYWTCELPPLTCDAMPGRIL